MILWIQNHKIKHVEIEIKYDLNLTEDKRRVPWNTNKEININPKSGREDQIQRSSRIFQVSPVDSDLQFSVDGNFTGIQTNLSHFNYHSRSIKHKKSISSSYLTFLEVDICKAGCLKPHCGCYINSLLVFLRVSYYSRRFSRKLSLSPGWSSDKSSLPAWLIVMLCHENNESNLLWRWPITPNDLCGGGKMPQFHRHFCVCFRGRRR